MGAIAGIFLFNDRVDDELRLMSASLDHRGPHIGCNWQSGPVGMVERTLFPVAGSPPSRRVIFPAGEQDSLVIAADARIDNRDELIASLGIDRDHDPSDSELILKAYERWQDHCPGKIVGDFSFSIWDGRRNSLFCARDHMGVKPFYYFCGPGNFFAFASEIKALLALPGVSRDVNELKIADYLVAEFEDKEITFYKDVSRLPPAHFLTVTPRGISKNCYWKLDGGYELKGLTDEEYAAAFSELFTEAVRCRLRGGDRPGSLLSGGLDSSAIVCRAREHLADDPGQDGGLHTFSVVFNKVRECDERRYINAVTSGGGLKPHFVHGDDIGPFADIESAFWCKDEPFYTPNLYLHRALYAAAQRQGVDILLDGIDGDSAVSHGLARLAELAARGRWLKLAREATAVSKGRTHSARRMVRDHAVRPFAPDALIRTWRAATGRSRSSVYLTPPVVINPDFARRLNLADRLRDLSSSWERPARSAREDHLRRLTWGGTPLLLEVADSAAAAVSVVPRYPFFDRRLIEFCLSLPSRQKLDGGFTRVVMRRALADSYPEELRRRRDKSNLSPNFIRGLRVLDRKLVGEIIEKDIETVAEYVDIPVLHNTYQRFLSSGSNEDALGVWRAATLALWFGRKAGVYDENRSFKAAAASAM